ISDGYSVIEPSVNAVRCDNNGFFSLTVPANDDSTTIPVGSSYVVSITSGTTIVDFFGVVVPKASWPSVDLFSSARLGAAPPISTPFVESLDGLNGVLYFVSPDDSIDVGQTGASITLERGGGPTGPQGPTGAT